MNDNAATPRVSIALGVHNGAAFVADALASALDQSLVDLEVIVCDDGSTDDTGDIVRHIARTDHRVVLLRNARRQGLSTARNRAFEAARGRWLALLDGDDLYDRRRLEDMVAFAEASRADIVADGFRIIDGAGNETGEVYLPASRDGTALTIEAFIEDGMPSGRRFNVGYLKPLFRRDFIETHGLRYLEPAWCGQDYAFDFACLLAGADWRLMNRAMYQYRQCPRERTLSQRVAKTERHRDNNRYMLELARHRPDLLPLLLRRNRLFDYSLRYERLTTSMKAFDPVGVIKSLRGGPGFWAYCANTLAARLRNRPDRRRRGARAKGPAAGRP